MDEDEQVYDTDQEDREYSSPFESDEEKSEEEENDREVDVEIPSKTKDNIKLCREYAKICLEFIIEKKKLKKNIEVFNIIYSHLIKILSNCDTKKIITTIDDNASSLKHNIISKNHIELCQSLKKVLNNLQNVKKSYKYLKEIEDDKENLIEIFNTISQELILNVTGVVIED